jgi:hypothetical protein
LHTLSAALSLSFGCTSSKSTQRLSLSSRTHQPLIEEYTVAGALWRLSSTDLCEIARNSVLQSGFSDGYKAHWLGEEFHKVMLPCRRPVLYQKPDLFFYFTEMLRAVSSGPAASRRKI